MSTVGHTMRLGGTKDDEPFETFDEFDGFCGEFVGAIQEKPLRLQGQPDTDERICRNCAYLMSRHTLNDLRRCDRELDAKETVGQLKVRRALERLHLEQRLLAEAQPAASVVANERPDTPEAVKAYFEAAIEKVRRQNQIQDVSGQVFRSED